MQRVSWHLFVILLLFAGVSLCKAQIVPANIDVRNLPGTYVTTAMKPFGYFPVLIETPTGELISVLRGGAGHMGVKGSLLLIRSKDGGRTWSNPSVAVDSEWDDRNPALGVLSDGALVLGYHENQCYDSEGKYVTDGSRHAYARFLQSRDDGITWSHLVAEDWKGFANLQYCSPFGPIVVEPNGQLLLALYGHPGLLEGKSAREEKYDTSYLMRSRDTGYTWDQPSKIADGMNETALLVTRKGDYLAFLRSSDQARLYVARSNNRGFSWTKPEAITEAAEHPATAVILGNEAILLIFGVRHKPYGIQGILSFDDGKTWDTAHRIILDDKLTSWDIGYPAAVRRSDGTIVTIYYANDFPPDPWGYATSRAEVVIIKEDELLKKVAE